MHDEKLGPADYPAEEFAEDFYQAMKRASSQSGVLPEQYYDEKYPPTEATEEKKRRFRRVSAFLEANKFKLNKGQAMIVGKSALAMSPALAFCVYLRLYLSKDDGKGATAEEVLDFYESQKPEGT